MPHSFEVIIEISACAEPVKYEMDKASGFLRVDRFFVVAMSYPCNYGFIPQTHAPDNDPLDVLVITPVALQPGVVVCCRAVGMLEMEDEAGRDSKILAVPVVRVAPMYASWQDIADVPTITLQKIAHFFEHYKDLDPGKWVKIVQWCPREVAEKEIVHSLVTER